MSIVYMDISKLGLVLPNLTEVVKGSSQGFCWCMEELHESITECLCSSRYFIMTWVQLQCHILWIHLKHKLEQLLHSGCCLTSSASRGWSIMAWVKTLGSKRLNLRWINIKLKNKWMMEEISYKCQRTFKKWCVCYVCNKSR